MPGTALLVLDLQPSLFTRASTTRPFRLAPLLPALERLVPAARTAGHPILWCCAEAEPLDALRRVQADDPTMVHEGPSAWTPELVQHLGSHGIDHVVLLGVRNTIRATVADATTAGIEVTVVEDGIAARGGDALRKARRDLPSVPSAIILGRWQHRDNGLGAGDSGIQYGLLPGDEDLLSAVREEVTWEEMRHRGGLVPRQIAVQASITGGRVPIYRHPADEHPPVRPWTPVVDRLRRMVEDHLGQPINHGLIQRYPDRIANISLHADKTLDVARGSTIVNLSLGATRTMMLQHKRRDDEGRVEVQRVPLTHGSLFLLGWETNRQYRHGVRPDRRLELELLSDERRDAGERISLTFRTIATFERDGVIEGQGARRAPPLAPREESRQMLIAFGRENREWTFDWDEAYAQGFSCMSITRDR